MQDFESPKLALRKRNLVEKAAFCALRSCALALMFALGALQPLLAADTDREQIETVLVTTAYHSGRWRDAVGAVDTLAMERQLPGLRHDSAELLAGFAGVQADSRSNYAQDTRLSIRGFGARSAFGVRGLNLRMDDIPLTMPDGQSQTSSLLLNDVARVEVVRGPTRCTVWEWGGWHHCVLLSGAGREQGRTRNGGGFGGAASLPNKCYLGGGAQQCPGDCQRV